MLEQYIKAKRAEKDILLMTHIVLGYPSFDDSLRVVESMVEAGILDGDTVIIQRSEAADEGEIVVKAAIEMQNFIKQS